MQAGTYTPLNALRLARNIIASGFALNLVFCLVSTYIFGLEYPFTTFLFRPLDRFQDFYSVMRSTVDLNPYRVREVIDIPGHGGIEVSNYFPFTHLVFYPFSKIDQDTALLLFLGISLVFYTYFFFRFVRAIGVNSLAEKWISWLVFIPLSYPILFTFDRANIELWVFGFVALAVLSYERLRFKSYVSFLALAASFKLTPLIFLFPAIKERHWRTALGTVVSFATLSLVGLLCFEGSVASNLRSLETAFFAFGNFLLVGVNGVTHTSGIFSAIQAAVIYSTWDIPPAEVLREWLKIYNISGVCFLGAILLRCWFWPYPRWRIWSIMCCLFQVLPFPSYDYKLLYTMLSLGLVILNSAYIGRARLYVWLFALTSIAKAVPLVADVRISVLINPILILISLFLLLFEGAGAPQQNNPKRSLAPFR